MRRLAIAMNDLKVVRVEMTVCPDVAFYLQNKKREQIVNLEKQFNKRVVVRSDPAIALDEAKLDLFDSRDVRVYLADLGMRPRTLPIPPRDRAVVAEGVAATNPSAAIITSHPLRTIAPIANHRRRRGEPDEDKYDIDNVEEELDRRDQALEDSESESDSEPVVPAAATPVNAIVPAQPMEPESEEPDSVEIESETTETVDAEFVEPGQLPQRPAGDFGDDQGPRRRRRRRGRRGGRGRNKNRGEFDNNEPQNRPQQNRPPARRKSPARSSPTMSPTATWPRRPSTTTTSLSRTTYPISEIPATNRGMPTVPSAVVDRAAAAVVAAEVRATNSTPISPSCPRRIQTRIIQAGPTNRAPARCPTRSEPARPINISYRMNRSRPSPFPGLAAIAISIPFRMIMIDRFPKCSSGNF